MDNNLIIAVRLLHFDTQGLFSAPKKLDFICVGVKKKKKVFAVTALRSAPLSHLTDI